MNLPRDEIAFRKVYQALLVSGELTTVFRPGCRVYPAWRGYKRGEVVTARVIEVVGDDAKNIAPVFNEVRVPVRVDSIEVRELHDLRPADFHGSSPDVQSIPDLERHLEGIYGAAMCEWANQVTRIELEILDCARARDIQAHELQTEAG